MANGVIFNKEYPVITKSDNYYKRALEVIPSVTQTMAKGPTQYINGVSPKYLVKGKGSRVWDVDGNEYIDFNMGIGPISLGYCYDKVDQAIRKQMDDGITFSLMHPLEVKVAEMIQSIIPNADMVRYSKGGADVVSAAVRLARAYTGKNKIICCGYHGWHDWYIGITSRNNGIPQTTKDLTYTFDYNNIDSLLDAIDDDTAAVVMEPLVFEEPVDGFLKKVEKVCRHNNVLLIFDEMWTGFRLAEGGAQEYYDVDADLACFSKAIANGMPLSVLTGKREIMKLLDEDVFFFNTFGGETLSLAAAQATIQEIVEKNVPKHLRLLGKKIKDGYNELASKYNLDFTKCSGHDCRTIITFSDEFGDPLIVKSFVQQEMIKRGILWQGIHNMCYSHSEEDVSYLLTVYDEVLSILKESAEKGNINDKLLGEPVKPVFRKVSNFNMKPVDNK